jgi:hypothetical protein
MNIAGCLLAKLMDDPLIGLVMKSDGVDRRELEFLLERAARAARSFATWSCCPAAAISPRRSARSRSTPRSSTSSGICLEPANSEHLVPADLQLSVPRVRCLDPAV